MLRDATQAALLEVLDANEIPYEHIKAENTLVMKDTRSRILFRSVDEFERLRGTNLAWFGLDELTYYSGGVVVTPGGQVTRSGSDQALWLRVSGRRRDLTGYTRNSSPGD